MQRLLPLASFALLAALGCSDPAAPELTGIWGGPEATLVLAAPGGTVEYACGSGTIEAGWGVGQNGDWTASGLACAGGGPGPSAGRPPHAATYAGTVRGDVLTFRVSIPDLAAVLGPFRVRRGAPGASEMCL
jgi:hypothetical protein